MEKDVVSDILAELKAASGEEGYIGLGDPRLGSIQFLKDNFKCIKEQQSSVSIAFIDGGNAELVSSAGFSVSFIRMFHTVYSGRVRTSCAADEFYVLCSARNIDGKLAYQAKMYRTKGDSLQNSFFDGILLFNPFDKELRQGTSRMDISRLPSLVRRIAEIRVAEAVVQKIGKGNVVLLDGDLESKFSLESEALASLRDAAKECGVTVCALSKTSDMLAGSGSSATVLLDKNAPAFSWYYHLSDIAGRSVYFTKLLDSSRYVFKFESLGDSRSVDLIFSLLAANSRDPVFPGYPYGLIEADNFARVSEKERELLRTLFMSKAGKDWKDIDAASRSVDAHSVLDRIKF
jgi:hypothetical protein